MGPPPPLKPLLRSKLCLNLSLPLNDAQLAATLAFEGSQQRTCWKSKDIAENVEKQATVTVFVDL